MAELKNDFRFKMVEHNVFLNHFKIVWTSRDLIDIKQAERSMSCSFWLFYKV